MIQKIWKHYTINSLLQIVDKNFIDIFGYAFIPKSKIIINMYKF